METKELARKTFNSVATKQDHSEGHVARSIEQQTAKLPSDIFLWVGLGCLGVSAVFRMIGLRSFGGLIGQAAAPVLIMGLYNKLVKLEGSDRHSK